MTREATPNDAPPGTADDDDRERYPDLADVLCLAPLGGDVFEAPSPKGTRDRLFGGQTFAQALRAAAGTVDDRYRPHSVHSTFVRAGEPHLPIRFAVTRTADGRAFARRQVTGVQRGKVVITADASFHAGEPPGGRGEDWHPPHPVGEHPESLPEWPSAMGTSRVTSQFDLRPVHPPRADGLPSLHPLWVRLRGGLPDPILHPCLVAFVSDFGIAMSTRWDHAEPTRFATASLTHAVWLHRPTPADGWLLLSSARRSSADGRCLVDATVHRPDGALVASITQEVSRRPTTDHERSHQ